MIRIPGTGTDLDNLNNPIQDGVLLRDEIMTNFGQAAADDTAVVTWMDYDPPDEIPHAVADVYARDAGPAFSQFNEGPNSALPASSRTPSRTPRPDSPGRSGIPRKI